MATRVRWRWRRRESRVAGHWRGGDGFGAVGIGGGAREQMDFGGRGDFDDAVNGKAGEVGGVEATVPLPGLRELVGEMRTTSATAAGPGWLASQLV